MRTAALLPHFLISIFIFEFVRRLSRGDRVREYVILGMPPKFERLPPLQRERDLHDCGDQLEHDQDHDRRFQSCRAVGVDDVG